MSFPLDPERKTTIMTLKKRYRSQRCSVKCFTRSWLQLRALHSRREHQDLQQHPAAAWPTDRGKDNWEKLLLLALVCEHHKRTDLLAVVLRQYITVFILLTEEFVIYLLLRAIRERKKVCILSVSTTVFHITSPVYWCVGSCDKKH